MADSKADTRITLTDEQLQLARALAAGLTTGDSQPTKAEDVPAILARAEESESDLR
jgi:hypothetical protein